MIMNKNEASIEEQIEVGGAGVFLLFGTGKSLIKISQIRVLSNSGI